MTTTTDSLIWARLVQVPPRLDLYQSLKASESEMASRLNSCKTQEKSREMIHLSRHLTGVKHP